MRFAKVMFSIILLLLAFNLGFGYFDVYLFLTNRSLTYPEGSFGFDFVSKYSLRGSTILTNGKLWGAMSMFLGFTDKLTFQVGGSSTETGVDEIFTFSDLSIKGIMNVFAMKNKGSMYYLDASLDFAANVISNWFSVEVSIPNVLYFANFVGFFRPVFTLYSRQNLGASLGFNFGGLAKIANLSLTGFGVEYNASQNGSMLGNRLVKSPWAMSFLSGIRVGLGVYMQTEICKGLNELNDYGATITVKKVF